jgi:hypothetical protein
MKNELKKSKNFSLFQVYKTKEQIKKLDDKARAKYELLTATMRSFIGHEYTEKSNYDEKNMTLFIQRQVLDKSGELLLNRSVTVVKNDVETLFKASKIKDEEKRRNIMLAIGWKYVTIDKLATDSESMNAGLVKKARNRDIVCMMLNVIGIGASAY